MSVDSKNEVYLSRENSDLCGLSKIILEKNKENIWIYQHPNTLCYFFQENKDSIKCQNVGKDIEPYLSSYKTDGWKVKLDRRSK